MCMYLSIFSKCNFLQVVHVKLHVHEMCDLYLRNPHRVGKVNLGEKRSAKEVDIKMDQNEFFP